MGFTGEQNVVPASFFLMESDRPCQSLFGYGLSVTTLQLAHGYSKISAADGVKRPLSYYVLNNRPEGEQIFSEAKTARQVRAMMETVVSNKGTAPKAVVPGYRVAGKPARSTKPLMAVIRLIVIFSLFAGMAPAEQPRLVMVAMIDDPRKHGHYGGQVACTRL
ncbi:MAG: penicillin-binding transpeptidase domain-containing protein [Candidatus Competibacteraceae bacterium]